MVRGIARANTRRGREKCIRVFEHVKVVCMCVRVCVNTCERVYDSVVKDSVCMWCGRVYLCMRVCGRESVCVYRCVCEGLCVQCVYVDEIV